MLHQSDDLVWGHSALTVTLATAPTAPVHIVAVGGDQGHGSSVVPTQSSRPSRPSQPMVEVLVAGEGRDHTSSRSVNTSVGNRLRHTGHDTQREGDWLVLRVRQRDPVTGLAVEVRLATPDGTPALRATTRLVNEGERPVVVQAVTSLCVGGLLTREQLGGGQVLIGTSDWLAEGRWERTPLRPSALPDISVAVHRQDPRGRVSRTSRGGWSSGVTLPVAGLIGPHERRVWLWQLEHNGSWEWEIGEQAAGAYLALSGPREDAHDWCVELAPGESFETIPVALVIGESGLDSAVEGLTRYRRAIRAPHPDRDQLPLVFNDYMNTLMGDPTSERLLPLIDSAAKLGAEVFCIDAGWYDDGDDWWDSVGEWLPSTRRFDQGLRAVLDRITGLGLVAGLWVEPEVIGVHSPMASSLPPEAFFHRHGQRIREHGRFHLDLRHPAARAHLDGVVDRLVGELGVGYLKFDYNIDPGVGTDLGGLAAGAGLLGHNRAYLAWLDGVLARHPDLILENCASGGLRADYALLSRLQLQSTSDQQDPLRYPPIAVAAPLWILPEQAASWAYPQPDMSLEQVAFTLATGLTGRFYLSGHVDLLDAARSGLVAEAVALWRRTRTWLATSSPIWPLGLPGWDDAWLAGGLRHAAGTRLVLSRRPGGPESVELDLPHLIGREVDVQQTFPQSLPQWQWSWEATSGRLRVTATTPAPSARVLEVVMRG